MNAACKPLEPIAARWAAPGQFLGCLLLVVACGSIQASEWFIAANGSPQNDGTRARPWDIRSGLDGSHPVKPGDTVWLRQGIYKHPSRSDSNLGYV